jgi:hypothetical protein
MEFSLLWSLFEGEVLNYNANANVIREAVERWNKAGLISVETFAVEGGYFTARYYVDGKFTYRFDHLNLKQSPNTHCVWDFLSGRDVTPLNVVSAILIIVYRYRNNLFHGEKWAYELKGQQDNFTHANAILMRAVELNRQAPAAELSET